MQDKIKYIEETYKINVGEFIELYKDKIGRKQMSEILGIGEHTVRSIASILGLRLKQKHREADYQAFLKAQDKPIDKELIDNLELTQKELYKLNKSLQKQRDINNLLRKQLRFAVREENAIDAIKEAINELPIKIIEIHPVNINFENNVDGVTIINISDEHIGALVNEVGIANYYNFEVAQKRIKKLIKETISSPLVSKKLIINFLGDSFDGLIHDSHLVAEMPVMEAVYKYANFISGVLLSLDKAFESVEVNLVPANHHRLTDDQKTNKKGFDLTFIFVELLKAITKDSKINIKYHISGYGLFTISDTYEKYGLIQHGDIDRKYRVTNEVSVLKVLQAHKIGCVEPILLLLLSGHLHKYEKVLLPNGGYAISVGSLMGQNEYAKNSGYLEYPPSQVILYYNKQGELISEKVVIF